jgi:hypothetical protein|tara:strand:+ start:786 stop:1271 length:486 start_codon:yes stop_codon:yes gene_type:complete
LSINRESKETQDHPYGLSEKGIPLTKKGRENRNFHKTKATMVPAKKKGRPKKEALKRPKGIIGRPKGDAAIINEYKARMLASPKSAKVLEAIFDAALDNDHKNQASAWKLVMDRVAPVAAFEKEIIKGGGKSAIQINITGVGQTDISSQPDDAQEGEYEII